MANQNQQSNPHENREEAISQLTKKIEARKLLIKNPEDRVTQRLSAQLKVIQIVKAEKPELINPTDTPSPISKAL